MPRSSARVVCTLGVTIATLVPTSALISVDLPALGAPISAMKPQRRRLPIAVAAAQPSARSASTPSRFSMAAAAACSAARLERPSPSAGSGSADRPRRGIPDRDAARCARPRGRPASAGRAPAPIPAAWSSDRAAAATGVRMRSPQSRSTSSAAAVIAAVEKHRADQRLADIGQDRGAPPAAGIGLRSAEPQAPRRDRSRAPRRRRFPGAPGRRAGATVRPRRPWERRGTACRR